MAFRDKWAKSFMSLVSALDNSVEDLVGEEEEEEEEEEVEVVEEEEDFVLDSSARRLPVRLFLRGLGEGLNSSGFS